jgi:phosphoserine aminotransferase
MSESRENVHNFAAGPSPLPTPVLQKAAEGLLNYNGTGMGVCELSHRGKDFKAIIEGAEGKLVDVFDRIADFQPISVNC